MNEFDIKIGSVFIIFGIIFTVLGINWFNNSLLYILTGIPFIFLGVIIFYRQPYKRMEAEDNV